MRRTLVFTCDSFTYRTFYAKLVTLGWNISCSFDTRSPIRVPRNVQMILAAWVITICMRMGSRSVDVERCTDHERCHGSW